MAKETKPRTELEREYVIPLRKKYQHVVRYKKTPKAVKAVKEFLARHMKIRDRDLKKIKLDKYLNEYLWFRGIKKPPIKVKVKAIKEGNIVRVELLDIPEKLKFKKLREEKREKTAKEIVEKRKGLMQKAKESREKKPETQKSEVSEAAKSESSGGEDFEAKEKAKAGGESTKEMEKAIAKQMKHQSGGKTKQPKRQQRKALAK